MIINLNESCHIRVCGKKEYDEVAVILDKVGKRWSNGNNYMEWSPYTSTLLQLEVEETAIIYIDPAKGTWSIGMDDKLAIGLDSLKKFFKIDMIDFFQKFNDLRDEEFQYLADAIKKYGRNSKKGKIYKFSDTERPEVMYENPNDYEDGYEFGDVLWVILKSKKDEKDKIGIKIFDEYNKDTEPINSESLEGGYLGEIANCIMNIEEKK